MPGFPHKYQIKALAHLSIGLCSGALLPIPRCTEFLFPKNMQNRI